MKNVKHRCVKLGRVHLFFFLRIVEADNQLATTVSPRFIIGCNMLTSGALERRQASTFPAVNKGLAGLFFNYFFSIFFF